MQDISDARILVVDDEPVICEVMRRILLRAGFGNLVIANTGADALDILSIDDQRSEAPGSSEDSVPVTDIDLVLLDIMLPDVTGYEVCTRVKQVYGSRLAVILLTGFTIEENHARYLEAGADDFITKPFERSGFLTRVRIALERKLQAERAAQEKTARLQLADRNPAATYVGGIIGDCYIEEQIWCGAASVICKATEIDDTVRAVKLLTPRVSEFPDVVERFEREVRLLSQLRHPNLACLVSSGVYLGCPYYVMEYVDGPDLQTFLQMQGQLSFDQTLKVASDIAEGLRYVHSQGIIHRDVTLTNILVPRNNDSVKLVDFGIAIRLEEFESKSAFCVGTPLYMAPEMFTGEALSPATDVYSYGTCLYYLITNSPPFDTANTAQLINKHLSGAAPPMRTVRRDVPEEWDVFIVEHCLAKRPEDRPQSMGDIIEILQSLASNSF